MGASYQPPQWLVPNMGPGNINKVGNYSFQFDGIDDYIIAALDGTATGGILAAADTDVNLTISLWVKIDTSAATQGIFQWANALNDTLPFLLIQQDSLDFKVYVDGGYAAGTSFSLGTWYNIIVTRESSTNIWTGYLDGSSWFTYDDSGTPSNRASATSIYCGNGYNGYIDGAMSEVSIYNYALSSDQRTTLIGDAANGVGNPMALASPPVAYYKGDRAGFGDEWAVPNQVNYDQVFDFNGNKQYISVPGVTVFDNVTSLSVSAWVKPTNFTENNRFWEYHWEPGLSGGAIHWVAGSINTSGEVSFLINNGSSPNYGLTTTPLIADTWTHIAFTYDGTGISDSDKMKIYINGISDTLAFTGTIPSSTATWGTSENFNIGTNYRVTQTDSFLGNISNMATWSSTLSPANITTIYNNGVPGDLTSLSPVDWWKLDSSATWTTSWSIPDDGSASNVGTSNAMTQASLVPATLARSSSDSNYSFYFDGTGDYINCGTPPSVSSGKVSLSAWVYKDSAAVSYAAIVGTRISTGVDMPYMLGLDNTGKGRFFLSQTNGGDISILTNSALANDTWMHIAAVADGTNTYLYLNGVVQTDVGSYDGTIITPDENLFIAVQGSLGGYLPYIWTGNISNVGLWNTDLSAANITTLYNNGRPGDLSSFSPAPVSWWKLGNDAFATAASPTAWTIPDQISTNDGTSAGNPVISGDAPGSNANGLSVSMDIEDRIGESGFSDSNAQSYNMPEDTRKAY